MAGIIGTEQNVTGNVTARNVKSTNGYFGKIWLGIASVSGFETLRFAQCRDEQEGSGGDVLQGLDVR